MRKFIIFMSVVLAIFIVAVLVLAFIEPTDATVSRSIVIKAPKEAVFEQMVSFRNHVHWSPWYKMDSGNMKFSYFGTDGQPGSGYHWVGSDKTGEGEMKCTAINGTEMLFDMHVIKPYEADAHLSLKAIDTAGMTKAVMSITMHTPFPWNAMCAFMDQDKVLGGDFELGLRYMKEDVEGRVAAPAAPATNGVEVKEVDYPAHVFEGFRQVVGWGDISKFYMDSYVSLDKEVIGKKSGAAVGIYYTWDTAKMNTDMVAAFPVSDTLLPLKNGVFVRVEGSKSVMGVLKGGYGREMEVHNAITQYITAHGLTKQLVIEEYVSGPREEPDSNKWVTNVYYLVK